MPRSKNRQKANWKLRLYRRYTYRYEARDLLVELQRHAKMETVEYILANMRNAMQFEDRYQLLEFALGKVETEGLHLEFGVADGNSIRAAAEVTSHQIHGFDSFEGLPEDWTGTTSLKGKFDRGGSLPDVPASVTLHKGWFEDSVPPFLEQHPDKIAFLHIDCDLYSSTRYVLKQVGSRLQTGTIVLFDEYFNYPNWQEHEFKAFQEFVASTGLEYEYLGYCVLSPQAAVRITKI